MKKRKKKILLLELVIFVLIIIAVVISICFNGNNTINKDSSIETSTYIHSKETVEENAYSLIALYKSDFAIYVENKNTNTEIAEEAKERANSTAKFYNNYIKQSSYWEDNEEIPEGILYFLPIIE